jgi:fructose-bisphosphate aldolase class II
MGLLDELNLPAGVIYGDDVLKLFTYAREKGFAIPAVNVTSSSTVVASLEAARDAKAPIILQTSQGGAAYFAGKGIKNSAEKQEASVGGAIAAAHYIRAVAPLYGIPVVLHTDHCAKKLLPWLSGMIDEDEKFFKKNGVPLFSSHMIDLSEEPVDENINTCVEYLKRMAPMKQWLEMEIGITGGEEDGVDNTGVDNASLYTQPEDIWQIEQAFRPISKYFSIAAGFGNVHGVYAPGNVRLHPELLGKHQAFVSEKLGGNDKKPVFFVFHGGSGSSLEEIHAAIGYGVVKMNIDTDTQYAYTRPVVDHVLKNYDGVLKIDGEVGDKKAYDPRAYGKAAEAGMAARVVEAARHLKSAGNRMK